MFICLSSGATARYREDIVRTMALPAGTDIQFRYDIQRWVAPVIRDRLRRGEAVKGPALIAYIDQHDPGRAPETVACRFAEIIEVTPLGTTVTLTLKLGEFAFAENLAAFNTEVRSLGANTLPAWQQDGKIGGSYWLEVSQKLNTVIPSNALAEWERIVAQLVNRSEFADETRFFSVQGVVSVTDGASVPVRDGVYELKPGHNYEIRVYHFSPKKNPTGRIVLAKADDIVSLTRPNLVLDSRYDLKRVRLRTTKPTSAEETVVAFEYHDNDQVSLICDIDLRVHGTFWQSLAKGVLLGILLASPQTIAALSNPALSDSSKSVIVIAAAAFGLVTGIVAAFGLKKSV